MPRVANYLQNVKPLCLKISHTKKLYLSCKIIQANKVPTGTIMFPFLQPQCPHTFRVWTSSVVDVSRLRASSSICRFLRLSVCWLRFKDPTRCLCSFSWLKEQYVFFEFTTDNSLNFQVWLLAALQRSHALLMIFQLPVNTNSFWINSYSASHNNWCTVGGDGGCRVSKVRAGTTSPMPDYKGFKLQ